MLDVFLTNDVEIWCNGWDNLDAAFPSSFRKYIHGPTARGEFGLTYQFQVLNDHGLRGVFFIEPLFARRFGQAPLDEIVGLTRAAGQEIQLHLHTEWADEATPALVPGMTRKRQNIRDFTYEEQTTLIGIGLDLLRQAGAHDVNAFRAGSFGFNRDTLRALAAHGIRFDSSYNPTMYGLESGLAPGAMLTEPYLEDGVYEFPLTVYRDGRGLRHTQLTSCSTAELEGLLWQALEQGRQSFVLLFHSFELLTSSKERADPVVLDRFRKLCRFLEKNSDCFNTRGFVGLEPRAVERQPDPLTSPLYRTGFRMMQQALRRAYG